MNREQLKKYEAGEIVNLMGYTSTTKQFKTALKFALDNLKDDLVPVVFEIEFHGLEGLFHMT